MGSSESKSSRKMIYLDPNERRKMRSVIFSEEQHENKVSEDPHEQDSWLTKILSRIFPGNND